MNFFGSRLSRPDPLSLMEVVALMHESLKMQLQGWRAV
jgi:hypothetical protein